MVAYAALHGEQEYPTDLSDNEWRCISPHLPEPAGQGRPRLHGLRAILDTVFYVLKSGCPWRMLPKDFPPWKSVYDWFRRWRIDGTWKPTTRERNRRRTGSWRSSNCFFNMNPLRKDKIFSTFFKEHDEVSLVEAYSLGKRDPQSKVKNRQWIGGILARWRKRGLVEAIYGSSAGSYGALIGIRLTKLGKTLLGKPIEPDHQNNPLAPADILEIVRQLKRAHPKWEVTFEIRLKEQPVLSSSTGNN